MFRNDTYDDAAREQIRLLRMATPAERIAAACSLTQQVRELSLRGLASRMPESSPEEVRARWAELVYGKRVTAALGVGRPAE